MKNEITRRTFVKKSAVTELALTMAPVILQGKDDRKVRLGLIGIGGRGTGLLKLALMLPEVEIPAICDLSQENIQKAQKLIEESGRKKPVAYGKDSYDYQNMLERNEIDGVIIATGWRWHVPMAIDAMKAGKYTAHEVGAASSVSECWELVKTYEETRVPCMILENACYRRENMALLNMVRKNLFGEVIHCETGYLHDLKGRIVKGKGTGISAPGGGDYRSLQNRKRNADLYPMHCVGPLAQCLDVNRGNRFLSIVSVASKSRGLHEWAVTNLGPDHPSAKLHWTHGDIVTTIIKCYNGETIVSKHDTNLPRPRSYNGLLQRTKGIYDKDRKSIYIVGRSPFHKWEPFDKYLEEFDHPVWKKYRQGSGNKGSHGGTDLLEIIDFVHCIKNKTPLPIDIYDSASWLAISPLSEQSLALGGHPVSFPDFTNGMWMYNKPIFGVTEGS